MPYVNTKEKKPKSPKIRVNKYSEEIVHIGAEIPLTLWYALINDSQQKRIPLMQNVRNILSNYYAKNYQVISEKKESEGIE